MPIDPTLLAKMQKLQTLASHNSATAGEAANAASKLQELLLRHNLTQDILNIDLIVWNQTAITPDKSYRMLMYALCKANFCQCITGGDNRIEFVGASEHIAQVKFMYYWLWAIIEPLCYKQVSAAKRNAAAFRAGCCDAIIERLRAMQQTVAAEPGMTDIILAKDARAKQAMAEKYPTTTIRVGRATSRSFNQASYAAGATLGAGISLQRPIGQVRQIGAR